MLTLISYVAVDFVDPITREYIFRIRREMLRTIIQAPKAIQKDPIYGMLVADGSIRVVDKKEAKAVENDPMKDITADGRSVTAAKLAEKAAEAEKTEEEAAEKPAEEKIEEKTEEKKTTRRSSAK